MADLQQLSSLCLTVHTWGLKNERFAIHAFCDI